MAANVQQHLEELAAIAKAWRASGTETAPPAQAGAFRRLLDQLYAQEWDYVLGEENELPDAQLPERYLKRRAQVIDDLEFKLADLAAEWRRSKGSPDEADVVKRYGEVMTELFRIGHWSGEPDFESMLPDEHMPAVYHAFWRKRIDDYRERERTKQQKQP